MSKPKVGKTALVGAVLTWAGYVNSLSFESFICKMNIAYLVGVDAVVKLACSIPLAF